MSIDGRLEALSVEDLRSDLADLGVRPGDAVLAHTSLRSVAGNALLLGGPIAIIEAMQRAVTPAGLLVMPAFSADHSDPAHWVSPPIPSSLWERVRREWPAYRADRTPTRGIGVVPEVFRKMDGVVRGDHPQSSFCAWGAGASLVREQPLSHSLGEGSPLAALHARGAKILLLGCGYGSCTSFHLAEARSSKPPPVQLQGAPVLRGGERAWVRYDEPDWQTDDFESLGRDLELHLDVRHGLVGHAHARLLSLPAAVDFAVGWLDAHR